MMGALVERIEGQQTLPHGNRPMQGAGLDVVRQQLSVSAMGQLKQTLSLRADPVLEGGLGQRNVLQEAAAIRTKDPPMPPAEPSELQWQFDQILENQLEMHLGIYCSLWPHI